MARKSRIQDNETEDKSHIWFYLEMGPFSLLQTTSLLCIFFDFTDKGHRRTLDSQDKRKPHCLLSQFMWRRFLHAMLPLGISHSSTNQNDETSTMVGHWRANVIFQRQMSKDSIFMHVWRLNLVWQERSINMEWRPRKNWFWNFVKSQITDSGVYSRTN